MSDTGLNLIHIQYSKYQTYIQQVSSEFFLASVGYGHSTSPHFMVLLIEPWKIGSVWHSVMSHNFSYFGLMCGPEFYEAMYANWQVNMQADCISIMVWSHLIIIGWVYLNIDWWLLLCTVSWPFATYSQTPYTSTTMNYSTFSLGPSCPELALGTFWKLLTNGATTIFAWHELTFIGHCMQQGLFACNNKWQNAVDSYQDDTTQYLSRDFLTICGINTTSICCISLG